MYWDHCSLMLTHFESPSFKYDTLQELFVSYCEACHWEIQLQCQQEQAAYQFCSSHSALAFGLAKGLLLSVNGSGYRLNSQGEWRDWSLQNYASLLASSALSWWLPELFRGALEPCWDNCFLCSSFLLFLSEATVGLNSWHGFCCCSKAIVNCTNGKGGVKKKGGL